MRILLIEDEEAVVQDVQAALSPDDELITVASRDDAFACLDLDQDFDLIVCDLRIPPSTGAGLLANEEHGLAVHARCRERAPGSPLRFFSGRASLDNLADALTAGLPIDLFGDGIMWALVHVHQKRHAANFVDELGRLRDGLRSLDGAIQVRADGQLEPMTSRAIRILARRVSATRCIVRNAGGGTLGLSGADTLSVVFEDDDAVVRARSFVKVADHQVIQAELDAFDLYVPTLLSSGFAPRGSVLHYGLRSKSAVSYVLADGFDSDLFSMLRASEEVAVLALSRLIEVQARWHPVWRVETTTVGSMRESLLTAARLALTEGLPPSCMAYEESVVEMPIGVCHGDLHGGNVLVRADGDPMLIDFGDVGPNWNAIDPVTLELSLAFHPGSPLNGESWPSEACAQSYLDLDAYLHGCPAPKFVRRVREWALDELGGDVSLLRATVYSQALRQLKYADTNHELALAYARGSCPA